MYLLYLRSNKPVYNMSNYNNAVIENYFFFTFLSKLTWLCNADRFH